ncbi:MAG: hypothetical protein ACE37F_08115 [Nannocystaceae bacterium]|nr:hypothetical protein [bacterium]
MTPRLLSCVLLAGLTLGCATSNDTAPTEARSAEAPSDPGQPEGRALVLEGEVEPDEVKALAKHLEALAEIHSVEISIEKTNDGPTVARLTLGGFDMPSTDELQAAVADFDGLTGDVSVSFDDVAAPPQGPASDIDIDEDATPEEIEAQVIEKLRADGVQGDIEVDVVDEDGERRVEVKVRDEQHTAQ